MRTRVKICGITSADDAVAVARVGADAIGLVFYDKSPRSVSIQQAQEITWALPPFVTVVALFVDAPADFIQQVLAQVNIDLIQFHGTEPTEHCDIYNKPFIKAVSMRDGVDLHKVCDQYPRASAILVDSYRADTPGGTGEVFNWDLIPSDLPKPLILAGGLDASNIAQAIDSVRPYAVDVSSGVERDKGIKDKDRVTAFIQGVSSV